MTDYRAGYEPRGFTPTPAAPVYPVAVSPAPVPTPAMPAADAPAPNSDYPTTFERVLAAVAYTMTIITCLALLYAMWRTYLFLDTLGDALRQLGEQWGQIGAGS